jgi:flagellar basal body P-ring protein FlgI
MIIQNDNNFLLVKFKNLQKNFNDYKRIQVKRLKFVMDILHKIEASDEKRVKQLIELIDTIQNLNKIMESLYVESKIEDLL